MRREAPLSTRPTIATDGDGIAAVLADWRGTLSERATRLDELVSTAIPEIKHVIAPASSTPGSVRLAVRQTDGEVFDAA